jgi:hypothetical protein
MKIEFCSEIKGIEFYLKFIFYVKTEYFSFKLSTLLLLAFLSCFNNKLK